MKFALSEIRRLISLELLALMLLGVLILSSVPYQHQRVPLASSETRIAELSRRGLAIVPASCQLSPTYYHAAATPTEGPVGGVLGYRIPSTGQDYGFYSMSGYWVCIWNTTGSTYFVPAKTASELVQYWSGTNHPFTTHLP